MNWIPLRNLPLPDRPAIDCFEDLSLPTRMAWLARVGLGEAKLAIRTPSHLSAGQCFRLHIAVALAKLTTGRPEMRAMNLLVIDELGARLDRISLAVTCQFLRRISQRFDRLCLITAAAQEEAEYFLDPDIIVRCDEGNITTARRKA